MNAKEAVGIAKDYVLDLFSSEDIKNVGLEEVEFLDNHKVWVVTIGFSRPWDEPKNMLLAVAGQTAARRAYKVLHIRDDTGEVLSVKNREANS